MSWENGAKPMGHMVAEGWTRTLLPRLGYPDLTLEFDFSALDFETAEDKKTNTETVLLLYNSDIEDFDAEWVKRELGYNRHD